jgi:hypothetical protein
MFSLGRHAASALGTPRRFDCAYLTLSADRAAEATLVLGARVTIPNAA